MEWARYKALCDQPDVWSGWMLDQCAELFELQDEQALADRLRQIRKSEPLATPPDHKGSELSAMYVLDLTHAERQRGLALIHSALAADLRTEATRQRGLGGFVEAWTEYAHSAT